MKKRTRFLSLLITFMLIVSIFSIGVPGVFAKGYSAYLDYIYASDEPGFAEGTIYFLNPPDSTTRSNSFYLYWADEEKALEGYSSLGLLSESGVLNMPAHTVIPPDAKYLIATSGSDLSVDSAYAAYEIPEYKQLPFTSQDALYTFGAISDAQLANDSSGSNSYPNDETHLKAALETLHARNVDFTVSSGDTVNDQNGKQTYAKEYRVYQQILADSSYAKPIYEANGNHDVGTVWDENGNYYNDNKPFITATGLDSKSETINEGKPYFEVTEPVTGDHFIFMALEGGFYTNKGTQFSKAQLDWLEGLLKKYSKDGKNIFIIEHANITGWGSGDKLTTPYYYDLALEKSNSDVQRFIKLMETYKECVIVTGHTHLELSAQYNYSDNNGTSAVMMHNSAIGGVRRLINGSIDRTPVPGVSEGYIVEVYDDVILFNGTNMYYNETIPQCSYIISIGERNSQTPTEPTSETPTQPSSPDSSKMITITLKSSGSATDWVLNSDNRVVTIVDNNTGSEYTATLTSDGWVAEIPESVTDITFHRVKNGSVSHTWLAGNRGSDTNYYITGDARGHWENEDVPDYANVYLSGSFNSWDQSDAFIKTSDANVVTRTIELSAGTYKFKVIEGSTWLGNGGTIEDTTTKNSNGGWVMSSDAGDCTLKANGGTYTFSFNTSTNKLIVLYSSTAAAANEIAALGTDICKYGDSDLNGIVNVKDATTIQKHAASIITLEGIALIQADVTADDVVNVKDATSVQKFVAGIIDKFPADGETVTTPTEDPTEPSSEEPTTTPTSPSENVTESVKKTLSDYYIYSSYDQYMALKNEYKYGNNAEVLKNLETEFLAFVDSVGGGVAPEELGEINIYFSNNKNWSSVYAYVWGTSGNYAAWPGTKMTKVSTNSMGEDIYKITVDLQQYQNIIFTNGSGEQTADIVIVEKDNTGYYISGGASNQYNCETYDFLT